MLAWDNYMQMSHFWNLRCLIIQTLKIPFRLHNQLKFVHATQFILTLTAMNSHTMTNWISTSHIIMHARLHAYCFKNCFVLCQLMMMDQHASSVESAPLQSASSMALSAVVIQFERFTYLYLNTIWEIIFFLKLAILLGTSFVNWPEGLGLKLI